MTILVQKASDVQNLVQISATLPQSNTERLWIVNVDLSGSMDEAAGRSDAECDGLSRLDLVKHSLKTITSQMTESDYLALLWFSDEAGQVCETTKMTAENIVMIHQKIEEMQTSGSTNIYAALELSVKVAKEHPQKLIVGMLLTDGQPNIEPNGGTATAFKNLAQTMPQLTMHCFGYGYNLNTKLLLDIARSGRGGFYYVPDQSMVGTCFVNFAANSKCLVASQVEVKVGPFSVAMQSAYLGRPRTVTARLAVTPGAKVQLLVANKVIAEAEVVESKSSEFAHAIATHELVKTLKGFLDANYNKAAFEATLKATYDNIAKLQVDDFVQAVLDDMMHEDDAKGQIGKAISKADWYNQWGMNQCATLMRAHQLQLCTNFKDQSVQFYVSDEFKRLQDLAEQSFCKIPAPTPSRLNRYEGGGAQYAASVNMQNYYDCSGGCVDGGVEVVTSRGVLKMSELVRGDVLQNGSVVRCVVKTDVFKSVPMCRVGGLLITPWHPVRVGGQWRFPCDVAKPEQCWVNQYFSLVVGGLQAAECGGIECAVLGHGLEGEVIGHAYFGTEKVIEDLKKIGGFEAGLVELGADVKYVKDGGLCVAIRQ